MHDRESSLKASRNQGNHQFRMTIDLNVLDHLGIKLYSNVAAVLTEVVANCWDADATTVRISIDSNRNEIEIVDNGVGMSHEDINNKYLRVGYRRRKEDEQYGSTTAMGRSVMGRKGLGKLSLFSIAKSIEVQSSKDGIKHGFLIDVNAIRASVDRKESYYSPTPLDNDQIVVSNGTRIFLTDLNRQRLGHTTSALRKRIARRFSVIGEKENFKIYINKIEITAKDRGDLRVSEYLWLLGDFQKTSVSTPALVEKVRLSGRLDMWPETWSVTGWIGTANRPKQLVSQDAGNLNSIVVFSRGRIFHENILDRINDSRLFTKYVTGQIEATFLDCDDQPDIATSDRQRFQEDDPRYEKLLTYLISTLNKVEKQWKQWRRQNEVRRAEEKSPALTGWFASLPDGFRDSAQKMIAKLSELTIEHEEDRRLLYRHGILAFERMRIRGSTAALVDSMHDIENLLRLLADRDALEASLYRDIVRSRLEAIKELRVLVDENKKERVLQKYLFDHLWLLDPSWERAVGSELMESRLFKKGSIPNDIEEKHKLSRVDIVYRTYAGKDIIVELKRSSRKIKLLELVHQGIGYVDKLKAICVAHGKPDPDIEVVFVVGNSVEEQTTNPDRYKALLQSISPGSRIVHYDALIHGAQESYSEYLNKSQELDQLDRIIDAL